ncbi:MAG: arcB [Daejeonella sp.]|nr:arcB [Daejeonella sp.]
MVTSQSLTVSKILFLEDEAQDVELMKHELDIAGFKNISTRVSSKKDFLDALANFKPDIILADYLLPMFNGMHAFRLFKEQKNLAPFILVTGTLSEELAIEYLLEGVDDFILKSSYKRLPSVITRNLEMKKANEEKEKICSELERKNEELRIFRINDEKARAYKLLSKREFEILCLIASGKSIKEIADQLFLSPATIATYRARFLEKLNLKSNVELTRYAMRNNLIN